MNGALRWCPTSEKELEDAEETVLSGIKQPFLTYFTDIGEGWNRTSNQLRTLEMINHSDEAIEELVLDSSGKQITSTTSTISSDEKQQAPYPLVLVHGFASGIGFWIRNLDSLASSLNCKIYAFDLLGFGRSSRPYFDLDSDVEGQFVDSIERWRISKGIDKFVLLGHSFGGYLSACYALRHPQRVPHVIMVDPWGMAERNTVAAPYRLPTWVRVVNSIMQSSNPLALLRVAGPVGPKLIQHFRPDFKDKFSPLLPDDGTSFLMYIYHCNAQDATGESAFKSLVLPYGWPKYPLVNRLNDLDTSVKLTFIYGSRSWIDRRPGQYLQECLGADRVNVHVVLGAGHHVYADKCEEFNSLVVQAYCRQSIAST